MNHFSCSFGKFVPSPHTESLGGLGKKNSTKERDVTSKRHCKKNVYLINMRTLNQVREAPQTTFFSSLTCSGLSHFFILSAVLLSLN